jgi:hypothetical protein
MVWLQLNQHVHVTAGTEVSAKCGPEEREFLQGRGPAAQRTRPRTQPDALTVAIRGPIAERMRRMAERHDMSLAKLLKDGLLVYEGEVAGGYEPGRCLDMLQAPNLAPEAPDSPPA